MDAGTLSDGHLWLHFTRTGQWLEGEPQVPVLTSGEGCYVTAADGRRYLDGLSALYCAQLGYGREDLVEAATAQLRRLPFATNWSVAHQPAIDLAGAIAERFPGDVDHVFFVNSGSEAVESAMKLAMQYHRIRGEHRTKFISRMHAYHGTTFGALSVTGIPALRGPFEPLRNGHFHAPHTKPYRCSATAACPPCDLSCARSFEQIVLAEGPEQIAAIIVEPVQNAGGCLTPPDGYLDEVRRICDAYGILMVSDEVICGFGRLGAWTGAQHYGVLPDLVTFAKGVTSAYQPLGGVAFRRHVGDALREDPSAMFTHGSTWGGHPVATAVGLANLAAFEADGVLANVGEHGGWFGERLRELAEDHELIGDVRGTGYFWALELVADRASGTPFDAELTDLLVNRILGPKLRELGLICRVDARDAAVVQFAPPLVAGRRELTELVEIVDSGLGFAADRMVP